MSNVTDGRGRKDEMTKGAVFRHLAHGNVVCMNDARKETERAKDAAAPVEGKSAFEGSRKDVVLHPLIQRNISTLTEQRFSSRFTGNEFFLRDHVVGEHRVLPGVAYLEMMRAAAAHSTSETIRGLRNVVWSRPFTLGRRPCEVFVRLARTEGGIDVEVTSGIGDGEDDIEGIHASGRIITSSANASQRPVEHVDVESIVARCPIRQSAQAFYDVLASRGCRLGPSFRGLTELRRNGKEALVTVQLPAHHCAQFVGFGFHPGWLDAIFRGLAHLVSQGERIEPRSPFALGEWSWSGALPETGYAHIAATGEGDGVGRFDIAIADHSGRVRAHARDVLVLRPTARSTLRRTVSGKSRARVRGEPSSRALSS